MFETLVEDIYEAWAPISRTQSVEADQAETDVHSGLTAIIDWSCTGLACH